MQGIDINKLGKILITGGTGFVGSYLTRRLVGSGAQVRIFDNNFRGKIQRLRNYLDKNYYTFWFRF